jgi:uncharacterized protein with NRDE domain
MCVIGFHWQPGAAVPLLLLANRDEFYERPTAPMGWWEGGAILAGRDLREGGAWLGVSREGRLAAVTNFRQAGGPQPGRPSRGRLVVRFLEGGLSAAAFLEALRPEAGDYNPFNLLLYDGVDLRGYESHRDRVVPFSPGIHAVSNGDFDEPWPKVEALRGSLAEHPEAEEALLSLLEDRTGFAEDQLPETGVPLAWEKALAPLFIRTPTYGTRASTLVHLGQSQARVIEQGFTREGRGERRAFAFGF